MGTGVSILLIAVGAILWLAVNVTVAGVSIDAIGVILVVVGALGLLWSLIAMNSARGERGIIRER